MFALSALPLFASQIDVYNHFASTNRLIIEGRILHKKAFTKVTKEDGVFQNLWRKLNQLTSDEIKNTKIIMIVSGNQYESIGDDEGYFEFDVHLKKPLLIGHEDIQLCIEGNSVCERVKVPVLGGKAIGIISDFDDTVVISDVTNKFKLLQNLLFKNYKQRTVVPTMAERFEEILSKNPKTLPSTLFFVTGSPQQLYGSIKQFLTHHDFLNSVIITKKIHGANIDPLLDQFAYKTEQIKTLFELYPQMQWVMFGDSGEKDRAVYQHLKEKYPQKVKRYYIRDVDDGEIKSY